MIFSIKFTAIIALASFLFGSLAGVIGTAKLYNISEMRAKIVELRADKARYVKAIGISKDIDKITSEINVSNDEIERLINEKIEKAVEDERNKKPPIPTTTTCAPVVEYRDPVMCVDANVLRAIGKLK